MPAKRCWECSNTFYSDFGATHCNVCDQAIKTRRANERQARQDRWEAEQAQRENARIQAQHTQALINAENRRIAAINHQTQVIQESAITTKYAYDRGYNYVDNEFGYGNPAEVEIEVGEYGSLKWKWHHPYVTDRLNTEFQKGLAARLNSYPNIYETIKASAKRIGKGNADGSFPSTHFTLYTGLKIGGEDIKTEGFKSYFTSVLDETTGELKMNWNEPFKNSDLNQAYKDGVNEVHWEVNTDEKKNYRLKFEVPKVIAAREYTKGIRRLNTVYKISRYALPLLVFYIFWQALTGWSFLFSLLVVYLLYGGLEYLHEQWQIKNNDHLR